MSDVKFGLNQLNETTPKWAKLVKRFLNFLIVGIVPFVPFLAIQIHTDTQSFLTWIGIVGFINNAIFLFFGIEPDSADK